MISKTKIKIGDLFYYKHTDLMFIVISEPFLVEDDSEFPIVKVFRYEKQHFATVYAMFLINSCEKYKVKRNRKAKNDI